MKQLCMPFRDDVATIMVVVVVEGEQQWHRKNCNATALIQGERGRKGKKKGESVG